MSNPAHRIFRKANDSSMFFADSPDGGPPFALKHPSGRAFRGNSFPDEPRGLDGQRVQSGREALTLVELFFRNVGMLF